MASCWEQLHFIAGVGDAAREQVGQIRGIDGGWVTFPLAGIFWLGRVGPINTHRPCGPVARGNGKRVGNANLDCQAFPMLRLNFRSFYARQIDCSPRCQHNLLLEAARPTTAALSYHVQSLISPCLFVEVDTTGHAFAIHITARYHQFRRELWLHSFV